MTYRRNPYRGTTNWGPRGGGRRHTLSGTVFGDDEIAMPPVDVSDPVKDAKVKAGCTLLEINASPGTPPYISCQQKVDATSGWGATFSNLFGSAAASTPKPASSSSSSSATAGIIGQLIGGLIRPATPVYMPPPQTGMSTTAKMALLAGGGILLFALMKRD